MVRFLTSGGRSRFWQVTALLWTCACFSLFVHTILLRNAPPHEFGNAEEMEELLMMVLSFPAGLLAVLPFRGVGPGYPENDPRSILICWFIFFLVGFVQWFVLVPLTVCWVRRRFGTHDMGVSKSKAS
jgi:hypothetical protein